MTGFWDRFRASVERWPDRPAVVLQGRSDVTTIDYRGLLGRAEAMAARLAAAGVGAGDRCALIGENSPDWIAACLAVLRLGAVAVPLDRTYAPPQVAALLRDSGAVCLVASAGSRATAESARAEACTAVRLIDMAPEGPPVASASVSPLADPTGGADAPALLLYTSGTTADPKGVVLTNRNLLAAVDGILAVLPLTETDSNLGALPLFHILAQVSAIYLPFSIGGSVVLLEEVSGAEVLRAMRERRITILCSVPQFFYLIHERIGQEIGRMSGPRRAIVRALVEDIDRGLTPQERRAGIERIRMALTAAWQTAETAPEKPSVA
ncbi:MAG: AMP-binding protein, partial [Alphaproteobacteria bacterium]